MSNFCGHFEITQAFLEIDEKFSSMESFQPKSAYDLQIQNLFSQYMIIKIARTVEGSIKNIIYTKCQIIGKQNVEIEVSTANGQEIQEVTIEKRLRNLNNPKKENIFKYFDEILQIELEVDQFDNMHFTSLGQILGDRHSFAHSDPLLSNNQVAKSLSEVKQHYIHVKDFIAILCDIVATGDEG